MSRSTQEATRFTATQPYATSRGAGTASTIAISTPGRPNETPAQKVARLREAARRAKLNQESTWDRVVLRGRVWADRAHKVTATGLIIASVVATGFAALSFGEMILANRGKKAEWYKQQQLAYERALNIAKQAEADGTLTSDLALFLNKERAIEQAEEEKRRQGTLWDRTKRTMFGGLKLEEGATSASKPADTQVYPNSPDQAPSRRSDKEEASATMYEVGRSIGASDAAPAAIRQAEDSRVVESRQRAVGGPLDRLGENMANSLSESLRGFSSWIRWR